MGNGSISGTPAQQPDRATRQLCAGAYLDRDYRDDVVRKVLLDADHRVAPSYGFDLVPVVEHAKRAMVLDLAQQGCFVAVLTGAWLSTPALVTAVLCLLGIWALGIRVLRVAPEVFRH